MPDPAPLIVATPDQIREMIRIAVRDALAELRTAPAADTPTTEFLDFRTAAAFTGLSEASLRRAVGRGELTPANTGCRSVRFARDELIKWMSGQRAG